MTKNIKLVVVLSVIGAMLFFGQQNLRANDYNGRKIIVFRNKVVNEELGDRLVGKYGGIKVKDLNLINAKVVVLPNHKAEKDLLLNPDVLRVDDDVTVEALAHMQASPQVLPWGVSKIRANLVWSSNTADTVKVGVIDTGISNTHSDLIKNIKGGVNTINSRKSWNDDNGHGSHVAGIIGASNNSVGVVGVAPDVDLYAIKVLNAQGSGYLSDIIEGIDWAIARNMDVVNMSLGTSSDVQSFHDAVIRAKNAGVVVVAAAGNSGGSVIFPAAYTEVIAVAATDVNNQIAYFSSRGPEVDLSAPGVSIYSTYKGTGYATLSGTSMAAPHVTGSIALLLYKSFSTPSVCDTITIDRSCNPDEIQSKLKSSAVDLGTSGFDNIFGWGLVDALSAIQ